MLSFDCDATNAYREIDASRRATGSQEGYLKTTLAPGNRVRRCRPDRFAPDNEQ